MGMSVPPDTKMKKGMQSGTPGDTVSITLGVEEAQNLLLALTEALGGGNGKGKDNKKKKKVDMKQPPFGK